MKLGSHFWLLISLSTYVLLTHWFGEALYYSSTPGKYGSAIIAGLLVILSGGWFYYSQEVFFKRLAQVGNSRENFISRLLKNSQFNNVAIVFFLTLALVWGVKGIGNLAASLPVIGVGEVNYLLIFGVFLYFLISWIAGQNTAVRVVNMKTKKNGHERKTDLVVFLSLPTKDLHFDENDKPRIDLDRYRMTESWEDVRQFSTQYISENDMISLEGRDVFNNLIPTLRGIQYHFLDNDNRGPLKRVYVICSDDSVKWLGNFVTHLQALFNVGGEHGFDVFTLAASANNQTQLLGSVGSTSKEFLDSADSLCVAQIIDVESAEQLEASNGLPAVLFDQKYADSLVAKGIDFEDPTTIHLSLELVLDTVKEHCGVSGLLKSNFKHAEKCLVIDGTSGMKPPSMVAAMMTIGREIETQYVQTQGDKKVISYDFQVLPKAEG